MKQTDLTKYIINYDEMSNTINIVDKTQLLEANIIMPDDELANISGPKRKI